MGKPYDLWHLTNPPPDATPCGEHGKLVASKRHGRGRRWRVRYTDPNGDVQTQAVGLKGDAERLDVKVRSDVARGEYIDASAGRESFCDFAERWRANQAHRPNTVSQISSLFGRHVYPYFEGRSIGGVKRSDVQGLVKHMVAAGLSPATVQVTYRHVSAVFKSAVLDGARPSSPCVEIARAPTVNKRVEPMPFDLVEQLRDAMPVRYRAAYDLGGLAGLRFGEAFGIEVEHIDFLRRTVRVQQQIIYTAGQPPFLGPPKTEKSRRTIPVGTVLVERLAAHLAAFPPVAIEVEDRTGPKPVTRTARLVTLNHAGRPVRRSGHSQSVWWPALRAVGHVGEVTFHDLRHFYASALIAAREDVKVVSERLGHKDAAMTLNVYGHLWPGHEDRTRQAIDDLFHTETPRLRRVD
jgi:integrase